ncbi:hypothetical protein [Phaeobacter sp. J2-8]|uniref:hypothetical protein n=1 Tax=Phaeobacter sp. J2-8 TaxID=2931394 RepID=UPI001FD2D766|nr:hypothetical protein [Phaeobacter sp. J2-8]MCJ7872508.1 hypothetical protein [Phaeobacter sp. J2-8]
MEPDQIKYALFIAGLAMVAGLLGHQLVRRGSVCEYFCLLGMVIIAGAVTFSMAQSAVGWDALAYFLIVAFLALPALAGLSLGGLVAWWRARRDNASAHEDVRPDARAEVGAEV